MVSPAGGTEGAACLTTGGVQAVFVANNLPYISVVDPKTLMYKGSVAITGGSKVAALSLSPDGSVLYAADYNGNTIWGLDTATILSTAAMSNGSTTAPYPFLTTNLGIRYSAISAGLFCVTD
jgi:DNA-binding beta-propeller fold protein YncE